MLSHQLTLPFDRDIVRDLRAGDPASVSGTLYTARDAAHQRLVAALDGGEPLPIDLHEAVIYYCGPTPAPPGRPVGSAGPTTSARMDPFAPRLYEAGVTATIGKGPRSVEVREACRRYGCLYLVATGGAGALLSMHVRTAALVAYPELGPEAIYRLEVEDFPLVVVDDIYGGDLYESAPSEWAEGE